MVVEPRTAVLLGAGASADAGLPLTSRLAEIVVSRANEPQKRERGGRDWVPTLNFVYGAMVGHQAENGSNPLASVNIERLISAVRLLKDAQAHEVAPFVASWRSGALGIGTPEIDERLGKRAVRAIASRSAFADRDFATAIAEIARAVASRGNPRTFELVEEHLLEDLPRVLGAVATVDYLVPLANLARAQAGGLDILTLNYDLTIEMMAADQGVLVERGIESWIPGESLTFEAVGSRINLIKLHGSLDWVQSERGWPMYPPNVSVVRNDGDGELISSWQPRTRPWIVVGDREKLATDGPTLALLQAAETVLRRAQHLVVVGYSFSDDHINGMIRNWLFGDPTRTIGIVDTNWSRNALGPFRGALLHAYGSSSFEDRKSRVVPIEGTTAQRLEEALRLRPAETPEPYGLGTVESVGNGRARVIVRLLGPDLFRVSVNVRELDEGARRLRPMGLDTFVDNDAVDTEYAQRQNTLSSYSVDCWRTGEEITVYSRLPAPGGSELYVHGVRRDSAKGESFVLPLAEVQAELPPH